MAGRPQAARIRRRGYWLVGVLVCWPWSARSLGWCSAPSVLGVRAIEVTGSHGGRPGPGDRPSRRFRPVRRWPGSTTGAVTRPGADPALGGRRRGAPVLAVTLVDRRDRARTGGGGRQRPAVRELSTPPASVSTTVPARPRRAAAAGRGRARPGGSGHPGRAAGGAPPSPRRCAPSSCSWSARLADPHPAGTRRRPDRRLGRLPTTARHEGDGGHRAAGSARHDDRRQRPDVHDQLT